MPHQETDHLLGHNARKSPFYTYLSTPLTRHHGDLILLFSYIITGLLDSAAVSIWGSFVSMQTGNTVYLGLGLTGAEGSTHTRYIKSGISIASFCIGSIFFSALHHRMFPSPRQRIVLVVSSLIQMLLVTAAAVIVTVLHQSRQEQGLLAWEVVVPLALVAFQSSGQAVTSRVLQFNGLTSVVLTSVYCDLFASLELWSVEQRRRLAAIVCLLVGTVMGGLWAKSEVGLAGALWTAVIFKGGIVLAWLGWREES